MGLIIRLIKDRYVVIEAPGNNLVVPLDPEVSILDSFAASALQYRAAASRLIQRAELIEAAARQLEGKQHG